MGHNYIFYHIYCTQHTVSILQSQLTKILYSGLYKKVRTIHCFFAGPKDYVDPCIAFVQRHGGKFTISAVGYDDTTYERFTLEKIRNYIRPGDRLLYIHTKGISQPFNQNVIDWRELMEYYLIAEHERCITDLQMVDIVSVNYSIKIHYTTEPTPHFSGNMWWCTADYFLRLPLTIGPAYHDPEFYCMKGSPRFLSYRNSGINHYRVEFSPASYTDT